MDRLWPFARWLALASLIGVAACGGSGSSGLDVVAAERRAIDTAIVEMACVPDAVFQVPYCPTGVDVEPAAPGPEPTPTNPNPVRVDIEHGDAVECVWVASRECEIEVAFSASGFEREARHFFVAATTKPGSGDWQVSHDAAAPSAEEEHFVAKVAVRVPDAEKEDLSVQVAVLMLPDEAPPATADPVVLGETDPSVVYVAEEQPLVPTGVQPEADPTPTPTAGPTPGRTAVPTPKPTLVRPTPDKVGTPVPGGSPSPGQSPAA